MKITKPEIEGLALIELEVHGDARGFFIERFHRERFAQCGLSVDFVQDNHSRSAPGVLRGLHYQFAPAQGKLVGVARGRIFDVVVDIRPDSRTFGQRFECELSDLNGRMLWIPSGFAHGFCVIGDEPADIIYKVDAAWNPAGEGGILWSDPELKINWPIRNPIISARDQRLPLFAEYRRNPVEWSNEG